MTVSLLTPPQTVGPFFHPCMLRVDGPANILAQPGTAGERIRIEGRILDGEGAPVPDALVEIWQANAHGRYRHSLDRGPAPLDPAFTGFGRCGTDDGGHFWFETVKPGPVRFDARLMQAPHILVTVFARGLLDHLVTRLYFEGEPANATDPVLGRVPDHRRASLVAAGAGPGAYRFDIVLQGGGETAFFRV